MNLNTLPGLLHALRVSIQVVLEPQVLDRQAIERRSNQPSIVAAFGSLYSGIYRVIATSGGSRSQLEEEAREYFKDQAAIDTIGRYRFARRPMCCGAETWRWPKCCKSPSSSRYVSTAAHSPHNNDVATELHRHSLAC